MKTSPVTRLRRRVNAQELAAADAIVNAYQASGGVRSSALGMARAGFNGDAAQAMAAGRADALRRFSKWQADLRGTPAYDAAVSVLFHERTLRDTERLWHWRNGSCMQHLAVALRHYAALAGNLPRGARGWLFRRQ